VTCLKKLKVTTCLVVFSVMLLAISPANAVTINRRFSLAYFDVDVAYPDNGKPGESVTISVVATAKKDCEVQDLSVELFAYSTAGDPRLIGSASVLKQTSAVSGNSFQRTVAIGIPADVPRSFLMAVVSENVRTYSYSYSYYYSYYYPYWWSYNVSRYWWSWHPVYYGYRTYVDTVDKETGPLTYVLATTPEYTQLKANYDQLTADHDKLTKDYNKLSSDYSTLTTRYANLNEEHQKLLKDYEDLTQTLNITKTTLVLTALAVAIVAALAYLKKKGRIVISFQPRAKQ